jgi:hypothetical protein
VPHALGRLRKEGDLIRDLRGPRVPDAGEQLGEVGQGGQQSGIGCGHLFGHG